MCEAGFIEELKRRKQVSHLFTQGNYFKTAVPRVFLAQQQQSACEWRHQASVSDHWRVFGWFTGLRPKTIHRSCRQRY